MAIRRPPFEPQRTEQQRSTDKRIQVTVSLNQVDQYVLSEMKGLYDIQSTSTMLRVALHDLHYVIHQRFSPSFIKYLFKKERDRHSYYEGCKKQNVMVNDDGL